MFVQEETELTKERTDELNRLVIWKLTALWAFSEAALGGVLHAFKVPFSGIFIGSASATLISLIAYFSNSKTSILKATLMVVLVKAMVSPHTPLTAYFAVFLQGTMGQLLFLNKKFFRLSAMLLAVLTLLTSSMQKIIILTVVFGKTLWESIDLFVNFVAKKFLSSENSIDFSFSYLIVGIYLGIHLLFGVFIGYIAGKLPYWIEDVIKTNGLEIKSFKESGNNFVRKKKGKRKRWWQRPSGLLFFTFAAVMVILSYFYPEFGKNKAYEIIIMTLRAIVIMILWYTLLAPLLLKLFKRYVSKKQTVYSTEINKIISVFPHLRSIAVYSWKISSSEKSLRKIKSFIIYLIAFILLTEFDNR